jgi:hypothetical protein
MKKKVIGRIIMLTAAMVAAVVPPSLQASPYASGITNAGGTIKFYLNETANSVKVAFDNNTVTNDLSPLGQTNVGVNSFSLGSHTNFSIIVYKVGSGVPSQISPTPVASTASTNLSFYGPRGVAVNKNPKGRYFGRIYVVNSSSGSYVGRQVYRGLYALNPDFSDALGQGTNSLPLLANFPSSAQWWGSSTTYGPYRDFVGNDDQVYVCDSSGSGSTAGCPLWMMDPNLTTPVEVFPYIGAVGGTDLNAGPCQSKPFVTGSLATGDLKLTCMMWNWYATNTPNASWQEVLQYNIGSGPIDSTHVWTGTPTVVETNTQPGFSAAINGNSLPGINGVVSDLYVGPNGYIYVTFPRSGAGGEYAGNNDLWVYDNQVPANLLWASSDPATAGVSVGGGAATNDCFVTQSIVLNGVAVSPDTNYVVFGNSAAANWVLVKLTNGIPDASTIQKFTAPNSINRSVAFDAADNVYTVEGSSDSLRVYSLGLTTTCITHNDTTGTNGTFQMIIPPTTVSVTAVTNLASQSGPTPGLFTITRAGQNLNLPLTVSFTLGGTATNGVYTVSPASITPAAANTVTFAANATTTNITIIPVVDSIPRKTTTVTLALSGGSGYSVGTSASDTISIQNTVMPAISVTTHDTQMYERTNDYARFNVTRLGDTNVDLTGAVNITFGGTAQVGRDYYYNSTTVDLPPGVVTTNIEVFPIHNGLVTGPLTVTATAASGSGYNVASPATVGTVTIVDSDLPPETVLWSDDFSTDTSANWAYYFGTIAGVPTDNYRINQTSQGVGSWPFDYSSLAVPAAPHSADGSTLGLYMTVNKDYAAGSGAAASALNFYPIGKSFSGNYALRFDMFLIENDTAGTTEYALFGVDHDGTHTNWFRNSAGGVPSGWTFDGIFFDVESDGAGLGDYVGYSSPEVNNNPTPINAGVNASTLTGVFKSPPWTPGAVGGGAAANVYGTSTPIWADVELSQINGVITWKINQTIVFSYTNTTAYKSGDVMLGYEDGYDSVGSNGGSVIYDNVRVISLASPVITGITNKAGNVGINFSANAADVAGQFTLQSAPAVTGPYTDVASTISALGGGNFSTVKASSGPSQFYRIRRMY